MKNKAPIFLNCLSRGGSNIFWNIFLSHPDACSPIRETLEIFRTDLRDPHWEGYAAALLSGQIHFFNQWKLEKRNPISKRAQSFIDETFYRHKLKTLTDNEMKFKTPQHLYSLDEVQQARLTVKNNNGLSFLSDTFAEMYPDVVFFALIRDPVPLYESHLRRKISKSPREFANFYNTLAARVLHDKKRFPHYHIIRFEDILATPQEIIPKLYEMAGLDKEKVEKIRFRAKPHYMKDGSYGSTQTMFSHHWFDFDKVYEILEPEINRLQAERVNSEEQIEVADLTKEYRIAFGYA